MKRRIMVAATGLSAGTLVAMSVVNPKVVSDLVRVELVKAEETDNRDRMPELRIHGTTMNYDLNTVISENATIRSDIKVFIGNNEIQTYTKEARLIQITDLDKISQKMTVGSNDIYSGIMSIKFTEEVQNGAGILKEVIVNQPYEIIDTHKSKLSGKTEIALDFGDPFDVDKIVSSAVDRYGTDIRIKLSYIPKGGWDIEQLKAGTLEASEKEYVLHITIPAENVGYDCNIKVNEKKLNSPIIKAKDVNLNYGEKWGNELGFDYAKDGEGKSIPMDDLYIVGGDEVNSQQAGEYYVKYYLEKDSDIFATSKVIVMEESDTSNPEIDEEIPNSGAGGNTTSNIKEIDTTNIMTDKELLDIYDENGIKTGEKSLSDQTTDFVTKEENEVDGNKYYSIGNNEWVMAKDVKLFNFSDSNVQTHGDSFKGLTKLNAGAVTDRGLEKSTDWYTDRSAYFENELHHRVATHEWVHDDHVVKYQSVSGLVHTDEIAQLYNSQGEKWTDRALAKNAIFFTDKKATIDGKLMYRVATDEWVDADTVTFK